MGKEKGVPELDEKAAAAATRIGKCMNPGCEEEVDLKDEKMYRHIDDFYGDLCGRSDITLRYCYCHEHSPRTALDMHEDKYIKYDSKKTDENGRKVFYWLRPVEETWSNIRRRLARAEANAGH